MKTLILKALRYLVGLAVLVALVCLADIRSVVTSLAYISLFDLFILIVLSFFLVLVSVIKWRIFLARLGIVATVTRLYRLYLVGYFVNLIMPSYLGGDVVRSLYIGANVDKVHAVSATMLERYTGFIAMISMALIALLFAPNIPKELTIVVICTALSLVVVSVALFRGYTAKLARWINIPERFVQILKKVEQSLRWGMIDCKLLLRAFLLSVTFHLLTILNTAAVGHAVGWVDIPWGDLFVVVPLILIVGALPISPQGLGIQEGAFLFFLHAVGASSGEALAVGLVLRAKSYLLAGLGGFLWMGLKKGEAPATCR